MGAPEERTDDRKQREDAAALFVRMRADDEGALAELMRQYAPMLGRVASTILLGRHDLAGDAVQDTFVSLWTQRKTLTIPTNVPGYLVRAVRNRALDTLKAARRYQRILDTLALEQISQATVASNGGERALEEADAVRALWQVIQTIPPRPRHALLLHWRARLSYAEIATLLGVKIGTVHVLIYRAGQKLIEHYRRS